MKLKCVISAIFLMLCFAGQVAAGALDDGLVALRDGNFATALRLLRPLAEQGDAGAQFNLGRMYTSGQGVPQDYAAAAVWYRKAADQGYADAQYNLGNMYFDGQGVPQNYAAAASWFAMRPTRATTTLKPISGACTT
jgi:TPR repeat protein